MSRFDPSDAGWAAIAPLLPGRPTRDDRRVPNGIFSAPRTGVPWRDPPERHDPYTTVRNRLNRRARAGVRERLSGVLA